MEIEADSEAHLELSRNLENLLKDRPDRKEDLRSKRTTTGSLTSRWVSSSQIASFSSSNKTRARSYLLASGWSARWIQEGFDL